MPEPDRIQAKAALDAVIKKSRVYLYKPIQIAEILYRDRHFQDINLLDLESYRTFNVKHFINSFWSEPGLKRSLDKIYEIIVYALFSTLIKILDLHVEISVNESKFDILKEFSDFANDVMCLDFSHPTRIQDARVYRVGVTNAADRGLDMYSNWGPAI